MDKKRYPAHEGSFKHDPYFDAPDEPCDGCGKDPYFCTCPEEKDHAEKQTSVNAD